MFYIKKLYQTILYIVIISSFLSCKNNTSRESTLNKDKSTNQISVKDTTEPQSNKCLYFSEKGSGNNIDSSVFLFIDTLMTIIKNENPDDLLKHIDSIIGCRDLRNIDAFKSCWKVYNENYIYNFLSFMLNMEGSFFYENTYSIPKYVNFNLNECNLSDFSFIVIHDTFIYESPNLLSKKLKSLYKNNIYEYNDIIFNSVDLPTIEGQTNNWLLVNINGNSGYVSCDNIWLFDGAVLHLKKTDKWRIYDIGSFD